jgi:acyl-CoA synthetase (AMP-forming)/AMP-acid ligase II/acyl carrier protein
MRGARAIAEFLSGREAPAAPAGIVGRRSARLVITVLGCLEAGVPFAILDQAQPPDLTQEMIRLAGVTRPLDPDHEWPANGNGGAPRTVLCADGDDNRTFVTYTTGPVGEPLAVPGRLDWLTGHVRWQTDTTRCGRGSRYALLSGLSHRAFLQDVVTPLAQGAVLCIPDDATIADPAVLARWLREHRIGVVRMKPALMRAIAQTCEDDGLPALRQAFLGGDVLLGRDVGAMRRIAPRCRWVNVYEIAEAALPLASFEVPDGWPAGAAPVHMPLSTQPDARLQILNDAGHPAEIGEIAELYACTRHLADGYQGRAALTATRFVADTQAPGRRVYRTGDLARRHADGTLEFVTSHRRSVRLNGCRVDTCEIAALIRTQPGIWDAFVTVHRDGADRADVIAYVAADAGVSVAELHRQLAVRLPEPLVAVRFVLLDRLPLTPAGSYDVVALATHKAAAMSAEPTYFPPRTPIEQQLAAIFEQLLEVRRVSIHDTFFELNGFSLLATQLLARIRETFQVEIPMREIFESPTVAGLAERIVQAQATLISGPDLAALLDEIE